MKLQEEIKIIESKINDPQTPQGDIQSLKFKLHDIKYKLKIETRKNYERDNKVSFYGSDDYIGASAGDYSFYFGYEVSKCPVKSHKTNDDCYEKDCEKREWLFQVEKDDKVVFEMLDSELSYPEADDIERKLIVGMAHFIKTLPNN
jgi:hypothetical protein